MPVYSEHPACRMCPQVVSAKRSPCLLIPRLGAGDHLRPAGKREAAGGGRAKSKREDRACFHRSVSPSRRLSSRSRLRHLIAYGVSHLVSLYRSLSSFAVSPRERLARASRLFFSLCRLVALHAIIARLVSLVAYLAPICITPSVFTPTPTVSGIASHIVLPSPSLCVPYEKPTPTPG